jgi:sugar lactone lactonase YvrE
MKELLAVSLVLASLGACVGAAPVSGTVPTARAQTAPRAAKGRGPSRAGEVSATPRRAQAVELVHPNGLALDAGGNLFITDIGMHRLLKLDRRGVLTGVAGTGDGGFGGDGGPAVKARLFAPHDVAVDAGGNLLLADTYNHRVRRVARNGVITTVAGNGKGGYTGDRGPARSASLNNPQGIALDRDGTLFIADTYNHVVRRVDPAGTITTFAGTEAGLAGDGGPANRAQLSLPTAVAVAADGAVYISDSGNNRIRRVRRDGTMETVLGSGPGSGTAGAGFAGDGGPVEKAKIFAPADLELNPAGDLVFSDSGNNRVRLIARGVITTIAGSGIPGFGGDGGSALGAALNTPQKIALGKDGAIYVADRANHRVRRVDAMGRIESIRGP